MSRDPQKTLARQRFAEAERKRIIEALIAHENSLWSEAAKRAKQEGLYAQTTYDGDAASGLRSHAGSRSGIVYAGLRAMGWIRYPWEAHRE